MINEKRIISVVILSTMTALLLYSCFTVPAPEPPTPPTEPTFQIETAPGQYTYYLPMIYKAKQVVFGFGDDGSSHNDLSALPDVPYYNWGIGTSAQWDNPNYISMVWTIPLNYIDSSTPHPMVKAARYNYEHGKKTVVFVYNEPDVLVQSGKTLWERPRYAAQAFSKLSDEVKAVDPKAELIVGGLVWVSSVEARQWWLTFIDELDRLDARHKVDGVHIHLYPMISDRKKWGDNIYSCRACVAEMQQAATSWYNDMHQPYFKDKPIFVTEFGWSVWPLGCDESEPWNTFYKPMIQWFEFQQMYDGAFLYVTNDYNYAGEVYKCSWLLNRDGTLTATGQGFVDFIESRR